MTDMAQTPAHARPARRDHLWVLLLIAACALLEVSPSWVGIGAASGFPRVGRLPTDWTLAVVTEAYWGYTLYAWLIAAAGPRSRRFAMWSAAGVFALSLIGQASAHLLAAARRAAPPAAVVVFVTSLPVIVLALIAVLVHLRHLDRAEAAEDERQDALEAALARERAAREAAEAALGDAAAGERAAREEAERQLETARAELARTVAKAEQLARKLAAVSGQKRTRKPAPKKTPASTPNQGGGSTLETGVPDDVDTQAEALRIIAAEPGISGSELGRRLGMTERYGCMLKKNLATAAAPSGPDSTKGE